MGPLLQARDAVRPAMRRPIQPLTDPITEEAVMDLRRVERPA
jgi:hypothetical protein